MRMTGQSRRFSLGSPALLLACFIVLVSGSLFAFVGWQIWNERQAALAQSSITTENVARSLSQHAARTIQAADRILLGTRERIEYGGIGARAAHRVQRLLLAATRDSPQLQSLAVFDQDGGWVTASLPSLPDGSVRDWPLFAYHRDHADRGPQINAVKGRVSDRWVLLLTRRWSRADGEFGGIVAAAIDLEYFQNLYKTFDIGEHGSIALMSSDGHIIAHHPGDDVVGRDVSGSVLVREWLPAAPFGTRRTTSPFDGLVKYVTYRGLGDYPFVVNIGIAEDDILAPWRAKARIEATIALAAAALLLLLGGMLVRQLRLCERTEQELREEPTLLPAAIDALPDDLPLHHHAARLLMSNRRYRPLRRTNPLACQPGVRFEDSIRSAVSTGDIVLPPGTDVEQWVRDRVGQHDGGSTELIRTVRGRRYRLLARFTSPGRTAAVHPH